MADTDSDGSNGLANAAPTQGPNPIDMTWGAAPFAIPELLVENNVDPATGAAAPHHLQVAVANQATTGLTGFSVYFTFTDPASGQAEGTYRVLDGFTVPAGGEARINFDEGIVAGHFRGDPNSFYITSQVAKVVDVTLKVDGVAPVTAQVNNDAGGAEQAG